jgi:hypothetical protein
MKGISPYCFVVSSLFLLSFSSGATAQDRREVIIPAGTLLHCALDEPDFSSKTVDVGDPVICRLTGLLLFNRPVFPRGAYLAGHLEADKEPGHFVGKGYLKIEFDRIGLPGSVQPLPAKVIAARGYKVNRTGEIVGRGHPVRDVVGWMFPPLWPVKLVTLPARGPRPTLKGEEPLTLRLMDDVAIPNDSALSSWRSFGRPASQYQQNSNKVLPGHYVPPAGSPEIPAQQPAPERPQLAATPSAAPSPKPLAVRPVPNVLALRDGTMYATIYQSVNGNHLDYVLTNGVIRSVDLSQVDWNKTLQENTGSNAVLSPQGEGAR